VTSTNTAVPLSIKDVRSQIIGIDEQVPLLDGTYRKYVNFDNAASTPCLRPVLEKVHEFMRWYSSVHRGTGFKSQISTQVYDEARRIALDFVGADLTLDTVVFGKNTTEALNKAARRFPVGANQVVLSSVMEHHSNDLPWRLNAQVDHIDLDPDGALDLADLERKLKHYAGRVTLVAITGGSNVTGYINPIHTIAEMAHAAGAMILVDAAQFAPHRELDMLVHNDPRHIDFVALSAHKMYAPFGTGALIGPKHIFEEGEPDLVGGGTVDIVTLSSVNWTEPPEKDEAGSPNVVGAVALARSMLELKAIGFEALAEHEAQLTAHALRGLLEIEGLTVYGDRDPTSARERLGVIPIEVQGMPHQLLAAILSTEYGIGVRNGCFCAHPYLLKILDIDEEAAHLFQEEIVAGDRTRMPGLVRISFGMYNTLDEVDYLLEALQNIVREGYQGKYQQDVQSGDFAVEGFASNMTEYFDLRS
jgi:selenocysteine lyase/cysteine desulfurase